jgi:5'-nucleotidase
MNLSEKEPSAISLSDGMPAERGATYTVAANSFIATGGDGFTVFKEENPETIGSDVDALEAHVSTLPQPFGVPTNIGQRITKQG